MQTESDSDGGMKRVVGAVAVTLVTLESIAAEEEAARAVSREHVEGSLFDNSPASATANRDVSMSTPPTDAATGTATAASSTAMAARPGNDDVEPPNDAGTTCGGANTDAASTTDAKDGRRSDGSDDSDSDSDDDYEEARRRNIEANK